jgi:hypothetical protein
MSNRNQSILSSLREPSLTVLVILEVTRFFVVGPLAAMGLPASGFAVILLMLLITAVSVLVVSRDRVAAVVIALTAGTSIVMSNPQTPCDLGELLRFAEFGN